MLSAEIRAVELVTLEPDPDNAGVGITQTTIFFRRRVDSFGDFFVKSARGDFLCQNAPNKPNDLP